MANRTAPYGTRYTGWFYDAVTPAIKFYNRGTLVKTVSGSDVTFADQINATSPATVSGNTSTYVESTLTGLLTGLENLGLITDNTTT